MKIFSLTIIFILVILSGCDSADYSVAERDRLLKMKRPLKVVATFDNWSRCKVTFEGSDGDIQTFESGTARWCGFQVGQVIGKTE